MRLSGILTFLFCFTLTQLAVAQLERPEIIGIGTWEPDSTARGLEDVESMQFGWYYDWRTTPLWAPSGTTRTVPFIPMIWDGTKVNESVPTESGVLLGFNEPDNPNGQADMTVEEAIALWPKLLATNLRLGSPAPTTEEALGKNSWLGRFMKQADDKGYRVDFIAVHYYSANKDVSAFKSYLEAVHKAYGKPVWVTEWALVDWSQPGRYTLKEAAAFAEEALQMLDGLAFVERHAYFSTYNYDYYNKGGINTELFYENGELTPVGKVFSNALSLNTEPAPAPEPTPAPAGNLMVNGSFETGDLGGWQNWGNSQVIPEGSDSGNHAARTGTGAGGVAQNVMGNVSVGGQYHLEFSAKLENAKDQAWVGIKFIDRSGKTIKEKNHQVSSSTYRAYALSFEVPSRTAEAYVYTWKSAGSSYLIVDSVKLTDLDSQSSEPSPDLEPQPEPEPKPDPKPEPEPEPEPTIGENLMSNASFEAGSLSGWQNWGNSKVVKAESNNGLYSARTGIGAGGVAQDVIENVSVGSQYRLEIFAKLENLKDQAWVGIKFLDSSGKTIKEMNRQVNSNSYRPYSIDFVVPSKAAAAYVYSWKSSGSSYLFVDDFNLLDLP